MNPDSLWNTVVEFISAPNEQTDDLLQSIVAEGNVAVEPLGFAFRIGDVPARKASVLALGFLFDPASVLILIRALHDGEGAVRTEAVTSLAHLGSLAVPGLLDALKQDEWAACGTQLRLLNEPQLVTPLRECLTARQGETRRAIVEALSRINDDRACDALAALLQDGDETVRFFAANALARKGNSRLPDLLAALDDSLSFRQHVATILTEHGAQIGNDALPILLLASRVGHVHARWVADTVLSQMDTAIAQDTLHHALSDPDAEVRLIAVEAARQVNDTNIEALIEAVRDASAPVRRAAVNALADTADPRVTEALVQAANDEDALVRSRALAAVGSLSRVGELQPLVNALANRDTTLRKTASDTLAGMDAGRVVPSLIPALAQDAYGDVARTLGRLGDIQAVPPLLTAYEGATYVARQAILEALGLLKDRRGLPAILRGMKDDTSNVREAAVKALDRLAAPEGISLLIEALNDTSPGVREGATQALTHLGPHVLQAMQPSLESSDWRVRLNAVQVLGNIGDVRAVELLIRKLHDPAGNVCGAAITELKRLSDARCIGWLLRALEDKEPFVRESVADVLMNLGDSFTLPRLVLAESRLTPRDRAAILDYMRRVRYSDRHITFRFTAIGDIVAYCMQMRNETDAAVQEGANAVLDFIRQLRDAQAAQPAPASTPPSAPAA